MEEILLDSIYRKLPNEWYPITEYVFVTDKMLILSITTIHVYLGSEQNRWHDIWGIDKETKEKIWKIEFIADPEVYLSNDKSIFLTRKDGIDKGLFIYDTNTGDSLGYLPVSLTELNDVSFSPDDKYIATAYGSDTGAVEIWDIEERKKVYLYKGEPKFPYISLCSSHDGRYIAAASDEFLYLYDAYWSFSSIPDDNKIFPLKVKPIPSNEELNLFFSIKKANFCTLEIVFNRFFPFDQQLGPLSFGRSDPEIIRGRTLRVKINKQHGVSL